MSRTSFTEVYSRKPTECRSKSDSKGSQNACSNFIENRKPTSCTSEEHTLKKFIEKHKNRLNGGGNDGGCSCSSQKSNKLSSRDLKSTKPSASSTRQSPSPCSRSYKHQQKSPQSQERNKDAKGNCPCSSVSNNGQTYSVNPQEQQSEYCSSKGTEKCICQSGKNSQVQGGCGGHSCGKIYSCADSAGGKSCFPRNHIKRNEGGECCGGTNKNSMNHGGCC